VPRNGTTWSGAVPSSDQSTIAGISRRGYTGHSMLGQMGLIHMNGRVQDAVTGRFLSPDPYVQDPGFTQSFNRYSYANNNPLTYYDPSGFSYCVPQPSQMSSPISGSPSLSQCAAEIDIPNFAEQAGCWYCEHTRSPIDWGAADRARQDYGFNFQAGYTGGVSGVGGDTATPGFITLDDADEVVATPNQQPADMPVVATRPSQSWLFSYVIYPTFGALDCLTWSGTPYECGYAEGAKRTVFLMAPAAGGVAGKIAAPVVTRVASETTIAVGLSTGMAPVDYILVNSMKLMPNFVVEGAEEAGVAGAAALKRFLDLAEALRP
jgi:RHS repeat-associated protein